MENPGHDEAMAPAPTPGLDSYSAEEGMPAGHFLASVAGDLITSPDQTSGGLDIPPMPDDFVPKFYREPVPEPGQPRTR